MTTAVLIYDWILTFPDEIRFIWRPKLTGARVLFLVNRYFFVLFYTSQVVFNFASGFNNTVSALVRILHMESQSFIPQRYIETSTDTRNINSVYFLYTVVWVLGLSTTSLASCTTWLSAVRDLVILVGC